ncbi:MAG: beta strand repeat-containing protein [Solirubrobacteraceae bacterium]
MSAVLGKNDRAYRFHNLVARNPAQGLGLRVAPAGVEISSGKTRVALGLTAFGRRGSLTGWRPALPRIAGNRVSYLHGNVREWFVNGPAGLEQGIDVARRPAGQGPLWFAIALAGKVTLRPSGREAFLIGAGGATALRYTGLSATDAHGRQLRAWLVISPGGPSLYVDDRGATYPITVDPFLQQGSKLVPSNESGGGEFGTNVVLASDGNTALIGAPNDSSGTGAAWVFVRSGAVWTQQSKLVGTGAIGSNVEQGGAVALSADGNTALIGGVGDNGGVGAAWVFVRSNGVWTQQTKIVEPNATLNAQVGYSVALSGDGNTALIGARDDNNEAGVAWAFVRSNGTWSQQGGALAPSDAANPAVVGSAVALSSDGNTALLGGPGDNNGVGAAWVFVRASGSWTQQGNKLVGSGSVATDGVEQGHAVALSSDGNTALIGAPDDNAFAGASWVFVRANGSWSQQGNKLVGSGATSTQQGFSVALTGDGNTALIGEVSGVGGAWLFGRANASWSQQGGLLSGSGASGSSAQGWSVALSSDGSTALIGGPHDNSLVGAAWPFGNTPSVSGLNPSSGPTSGGTTVTITGANFTGATAVSFGSTRATSFTVNSATQITATSPAGTGLVDVTVTTPAGTSATSAADEYGYGGCTDEFSPQSGNSWGTAANWSKGTPPSSSDVACWPVGTNVTVPSGTSATAMSLQGGDLTISGGSLSLAGSAGSTLVDFTESGGGFNGPGALALSGNFSWTGGNISQSGAVTITQAAGQTCAVTGATQAYRLGGSISTQSPVTISNTSFIAAGGPTLTTTSTVTFAPGSYESNGGSFLQLSAAGVITTGQTTLPDYLLSVTGTSSNLAGSMTVPAFSSSASGTVSVPTGVTLSSGSGTVSGTITGHGTYTQTGSTTTIASGGTLSIDNVSVPQGTLTVNSSAGYTAAGATTISGGTLNLGPAGATGGSFTESGGGFNGPGALALSGNFSWTGGNISQSGAVTITQAAGQTFSVSGTTQAYLQGGSISTQSPVTISNTSFIAAGGPTLTTTSTVTFAPGSYESNGGSHLQITAAGFVLSGDTALPDYDLIQLGGTTTVPSGSTLSSASLNVPAGTLVDDGTVNVSVTVSGGTLKGAGAILGSLTNTAGGTVAPGDSPGTLNVSGSYSQDSSGTLQIAVDGTASGQYSVLNVNGNLSLAGSLAILPSAGYAASAAPGDTIHFLPYANLRAGQFDTTTVTPPLHDDEPFTPDYSTSHIVNAIVGNPGQPTITSVSPSAGPTAGGTTVTITGTSFASVKAVDFGQDPAARYTVNTDSTITAIAPAGSAGTVDITVTTAGGTSATSPGDEYTYVAPPVVTSISPTAGPATGGTSVTITGTGFANATAVKFSGTGATSFTVNSRTSISTVAPAGTGTVDVTVTTPGGTSATGAADQFTYTISSPPPPPPSPPPGPSGGPSGGAPTVSGGAPSSQSSAGATVGGSVNPEGLATTAYFQYGLDPSFRGPGASTDLYDQSTAPQQLAAGSTAQPVSAALTGLVPGALYHVRLVAANSAGTTFGPDQTFTTAQAAAPPAPIVGQTENAQPISGTVFIRTASGAFVRLTGAQQIPSGATVDALHGTLKLVAAVGKGKTEHGTFGGAIFKLAQSHQGLTTLTLLNDAFKGAPSFAICKAHKAVDATIASSKTLQLLKASAHGKFRTSGRYSAATVRGTIWTVADRCDGTLTHDITDSVAVTDFVRHKTIILHAGQSYLAKRP